MTDAKYGSFFNRLWAYFIDRLLLDLIPLLLLFVVVTISSDSVGIWTGLLWLVWEFIFVQWIVYFVYIVYTYMNYGASIGKNLLGLQVVKIDNTKPTIWDGLMRFTIGYPVSFIFWGLGFIWITKDPKKQGFHDHIAHTYVLQKQEPKMHPLISVCILIGIYLVLIYMIFSTGMKKGLWTEMGKDIQYMIKYINSQQKAPKTTSPEAHSTY